VGEGLAGNALAVVVESALLLVARAALDPIRILLTKCIYDLREKNNCQSYVIRKLGPFGVT
jgi:hypothetical protein